LLTQNATVALSGRGIAVHHPLVSRRGARIAQLVDLGDRHHDRAAFVECIAPIVTRQHPFDLLLEGGGDPFDESDPFVRLLEDSPLSTANP
jgi:hypothetical protein